MIEMLMALAIGAVLLGSLYQLLRGTLGWSAVNEGRNHAVLEGRYAFDRMVRAAAEGRVLVLPLGTTVGNHFAVTLPARMDLNGDGFADADNDFDGRLDEDPGADRNFDGKSGIAGFDDDGDGEVDENLAGNAGDDDEDGLIDEDPHDRVDNDLDGRVDEDPPGGVDDDGDGQTDEDGYDLVLYQLSGGQLIERTRVPWDANNSGSVRGDDVVTSALAGNVVLLQAQRQRSSRGETLLRLTMHVADPAGGVIIMETTVSIGSRA